MAWLVITTLTNFGNDFVVRIIANSYWNWVTVPNGDKAGFRAPG